MSTVRTPRDITVVGLGYVGLPLTLAFAAEFETVGFDNDASRVEELQAGNDRNLEVEAEEISASNATFSSDESCITEADCIVVTVPTPLTDGNRPDLSLLESASGTIGRRLASRSSESSTPIIVFESTTYPGCTEDFCAPIIERESGLKSGEGFVLGYSPERTNFGDSEHTLDTVVKVVSGQTSDGADVIADVYSRIAKAGIHMAPDIKTAEASKVIENVQRDLNIALFNESAMIFDRMGINSSDVFDAAGTKWNFHRYQPGLVGGHCIPVDPYYLTYAAEETGYFAEVILAGRSVNEAMVGQVAEKIEQLLAAENRAAGNTDVLILGQTFKEDVADFRNSKAVRLKDLMAESFGTVSSFDPYAELGEGISDPFTSDAKYGVVVLAMAHSQFVDMADKLIGLVESGGLLVDLSGTVDPSQLSGADLRFWNL